VQQAVIQGTSRAEIHVGIVWVNMLPLDGIATARLAAQSMQAPFVRHFHDAGKQAGRAVAQSLGVPGKVAWDVYLFYAKDGAWDHDPPSPIRWAHQLSGSWADPARYRHGTDLLEELYRAMNELTGASEAGT
jgi:hypothetical protein